VSSGSHVFQASLWCALQDASAVPSPQDQTGSRTDMVVEKERGDGCHAIDPGRVTTRAPDERESRKRVALCQVLLVVLLNIDVDIYALERVVREYSL
jgi:hypothetical protein